MVQQGKNDIQKWAPNGLGGHDEFDSYVRSGYPLGESIQYESLPFSGPNSAISLASPITPRTRLSSLIDKTLAEENGYHSPTFALVYLDGNGDIRYEACQSLEHRLEDLFDSRFAKRFQSIAADPSSGSQSYISSKRLRDDRKDRDISRPNGSRRSHSSRVNSGQPHNRKRRAPVSHQPATRQYEPESPEEDADELYPVEEQPQTIKHQKIRVGDHVACTEFYKQRFHLIQQVPCKLIAKDWIKAIEPRKQTKFPYNGGKKAKDARDKWEADGKPGAWDAEMDGKYSRPPWWPEDVKHKEPDHIKKKERVNLLLHLLTNLYHNDPEIRVAQLKQSTKRTVASFGEIKGGPGAELLEKWLSEIYQLREKQEQYLEGGIDANATVSFPEPLIEPRRTPKKTHSQPQHSHRDRYTQEMSDIEQSDDDPPDNEMESPTSLTTPVRNMELDTGISMAQRNGYDSAMSNIQTGIYPGVGDMADAMTVNTPQLDPDEMQSNAMKTEVEFFMQNCSANYSEPGLQRPPLIKANSTAQELPTTSTQQGTIRQTMHPCRNNSLPNTSPGHSYPETWQQQSAPYTAQASLIGYHLQSSEGSEISQPQLLMHDIQQHEILDSFSSNGSGTGDFSISMGPPYNTQVNGMPQVPRYPHGVPTGRQSFG